MNKCYRLRAKFASTAIAAGIAICAFVSVSPQVPAAAIYQYTGHHYDVVTCQALFFCGGVDAATTILTGNIKATFTFPDVGPDYTGEYGLNVKNYSISASGIDLSPNKLGCASGDFIFKNGKIVEWEFNAIGFSKKNCEDEIPNLSITSLNRPSKPLEHAQDVVFARLHVLGAIGLDPGTWTLIGASPLAVNETASTSSNADVAINLSAGVSAGVGGEATSAAIVTGPKHGTISVISGTTATYTPDVCYTGIDSFEFTLSNQIGASESATAQIEVTAPTSSTSALYLVDPFLLGALDNNNDLSNLDLDILYSKKNWTSVQANGLEADNSSAAIAIFQTNNCTNNVTFTTNNGTTVFEYSSSFLSTAPSVGAKSRVIKLKKIGALLYGAALIQTPATGATYAFSNPVTGANPIVVTATQGQSSTQASMNLDAPPVLLLHGIWGTAQSLATIGNYLKTQEPWVHQNTPILAINYPNAIKFDAAEPAVVLSPASAVDTAITTQLKLLDKTHVVGARVDIVAHSMGGLVARYYSSRDAYTSPRDRGQGRVHEIITLNTPENGSALATYLFTHAKSLYNKGNDHRCNPLDNGDALACAASEVWSKANCLPTDDTALCFQHARMPLAENGQDDLTTGAVYSLIPPDPTSCSLRPSPSLCATSPPSIQNAIWRAISSVRSQGFSTPSRGEPALQLALEGLIAAINPPDQAHSISKILDDDGQDDAVVTRASQLGTATQRAQSGQFVTISGLTHTSTPGADELPHWILSNDNVEADPRVNATVACWLAKEGSPSCIPLATAPSIVDVSDIQAATSASEPRPKAVDRIRVNVPQRMMLATPVELSVQIKAKGLEKLTIDQEDDLGHHAKTQDLTIDRVIGDMAFAKMTPMQLGSVRFSLIGQFRDGGYSVQHFQASVEAPAFLPQRFLGDVNFREVDLRLVEGGAHYALQPRAIYAAMPDESVDLAGRVQYRLLPGDGAPVINLQPTGAIEALRLGKAVIEVRFGSAVDHIQVIVDPR